MAPIKTEAIILRKNNFRETSVILWLYTRHFGRIKGILKGARVEKGRIAPLTFTPGAHIFAFFYMKRFSDLHLVSTPSLINYYEIKTKKNMQTWYQILNLVNLFAPEKEKENRIFRLLETSGGMLESDISPEILFVAFKLKLIQVLGYGIELAECTACRSAAEKIPLFSGKLGGLMCRKCEARDKNPVRMSPGVLAVMQQFEKMEFEKTGIIKSVPREILQKINFYMNITLNYHAGMDKIWWYNEKSILQKNN